MWRALDLADGHPGRDRRADRQYEGGRRRQLRRRHVGSLESLRSANVDVVAKLAAAVRGVRTFTSSTSALPRRYGAQWPGKAITERPPPKPVSDYGVTKLEATMQLLAAGSVAI